MNTTKTLLSGLTLLLLSGLITAIATETKKTTIDNPASAITPAINCSPSLNLVPNATDYVLPVNPDIFSRKNAGSLNAQSTIIKSFRKGIELMQALPNNDYRKWDKFIKIHGTSSASYDPIYNT